VFNQGERKSLVAVKLRRKGGKPQAQQQQQAPDPPAPAASNWSLPADWREQLTATKPKGRFTYGENVQGGPRR
jgi:hypothetical protein